MTDNIGTLLFKEKQLRLLLALSNTAKEWYLTDLAKAADVTYIHTSRFISRCESAGLVTTEVHGRMKRLFLTAKGKEIAESIMDVVNRINQKENTAQQEKQAQQPAPLP